MDCSHLLTKALFSKNYSRKPNKKLQRNSGLVPTTLAEPSDSILCSPKLLSHPEPTGDVFMSSEFVFTDEIDDEISKEIYEYEKNENIIKKEMSRNEVIDSLIMPRSGRVGGDSVEEMNLDLTGRGRKRPSSKSRDGSSSSSGGRTGAQSKKARKGSEEPVVVVHEKEDKTKCTKCKEFFDPSEFRRHNRNEHEFGCDQDDCDYFLETELALINHKKRVHMIEPSNSYSSNWQLVCEACGKSIQGHKWDVHKTTVHPHPCEEDTGCFMRFLTQAELTRHINLMHKPGKSKQNQKQASDVEIIACVPKIKKTVTKSAVVREMPDPAPSMTPLALRAGSPLPSDQHWVCHTCTDIFTSQASYDKHLSNAEKKHVIPCEKAGCKKVMPTKASLLKHMWDMHKEQVKQVKYCERCKDVVDVKSWAAHEKKEHDSMCGYIGCGAQVPTNKGLWLHMVKKHEYGRIMNPGEESEEEEEESEDDDMSDFEYPTQDFETSLDLDVDEIENEVIREDDAKSKTSVESYEEIEQVVEADEGEFIKCKVCELLVRRSKIMAHSNKIHKYKCIDGCDLAFTQEHLMFNHCYVEHNNTKRISEKGYLVCPECSEFFESCLQRSYDLHVKTGIHLACSKCELKFGKSKEDEFKFHQDFAHQADSDVPCGTCDLVFTYSDTKLLERHRKEEHKVGPCPHCKEISEGNLLFVTKERFIKHHDQEHSLLATLGCHCVENIGGDSEVHGDIKTEFFVKGEDAYDLSEQITDESSIDEEVEFDYKNFKTDVTGTLKDTFHTENCLDLYIDSNLAAIKDEIEADLPVKKSYFKPGEVEISVQAEVDDKTVVGKSSILALKWEMDEGKRENIEPSDGAENLLKNEVRLKDEEIEKLAVIDQPVVKGSAVNESVGIVVDVKADVLKNYLPEELAVEEFGDNILEVFEDRNEDEVESKKVGGIEALEGQDYFKMDIQDDFIMDSQDHFLLDIQDNSISTTENIPSPVDKVVPVEELIDSDPEVSSSDFQSDLDRLGEESKDSDFSQTDSENVENLIGIPHGVRYMTDEREVKIEEEIVNIAPEIKREAKNSPFNLVPYVDTDSDCDSVEDHEKRVAAGKLAAKAATNHAMKQEKVCRPVLSVDGVQEVPIKIVDGNIQESPAVVNVDSFQVKAEETPATLVQEPTPEDESISRKQIEPNTLLRRVMAGKVVERWQGARAVSSAAQIENLEREETHCEQPEEIEVDEFIKQIEAKKISDFGTVGHQHDVETPAHCGSPQILIQSNASQAILNEIEDVSPSKEEISRAIERIRKRSGDENHPEEIQPVGEKVFKSGVKFSLTGTLGRSTLRASGPPRGDIHEELINLVTQTSQTLKKEDEYTFPAEQVKTEVEVGSYQALVRPGKPGRKKPSRSALSHETEETQMQADMARQLQEKRNNRTRQMVTGRSQVQPGSSALRSTQPTSVIRPVPRHPATDLSNTQQPGGQARVFAQGQTVVTPSTVNTTLLRQMIPQVPMQFVTIPSSAQQPQQASKRPPTVAECEALTPEPEPWQSHKHEPHRTYGKARRSTQSMDHSYVMDMDCAMEEDFDLSQKLEEMEKDFEESDTRTAVYEESLENIKCLLDSQVTSQDSSSICNSSQSISLSDGDELGMSDGVIVLDDSIQPNNSVISINSSMDDTVDNIVTLTTDNITQQDKEVRVSPTKKSQDETYDDVDDLLGDSDEDDQEEEKIKYVPVPVLVKALTPSEPSRKKPPKFVCPECNQKYGKNEAQYNNHIRQQHNFPCKFCPLKFTYVNGLEEHLNSVHINETAEENSTSFCCNICNKSFTRQGPYLKHKKRDHNIPCIECDMVFTNEPFLEEHMASMHGINSPPSGKMVKMRKPTSPVEVKFQLANGMIADSPKKIKPKEDNSSKKEVDRKASLKIDVQKDSSKRSKSAKSLFKKMKDISAISDDDTICEKCGQKFEELEAFEHHIELPHEHQCGMKNCELSFVFQYYLDLHIFVQHKTGIKPDDRDKPIEESVKVATSSFNDSSMEEQISLADLAVSEDYLPGIGPQSMMCGGDPAKMKSLKGYKIPKKSASPASDDLDMSLDSSFNSSLSNLENTPVRFSSPHSSDRSSPKCYQCDLTFNDRISFEEHIANHYTASGSSSNSCKCYECNVIFKNKEELDRHVASHYSPSSSRQQTPTSLAATTKKLKCPLCTQYFEEMSKMMVHLKANHGNGKIEKKHDFWCGLCRKGFETERKFEDHEKIPHKYGCKHCHKAYTLEVDLNHHVEKHHVEKSVKVQTKHKEGFTCQLCGVNIGEMEMFKIHQSQGHNAPCYLDGCYKRFQHKTELLVHLKSVHNVVQIRIGDDTDEEHRGYLTTERSQANIDIAEWAESWIDSPMAIEHMVKVMKGVVKSRRHDLFLDKRERDQCSGSETSRLYQLSNPGFLGGGGEKDTVVIKHLIDRVFMVHFHEADHKLTELGSGSAFVYTSCVLFPETFIHQHQVQGKSREEAEQAFMEVAVDVEERKGLNQEIKEAAVRNRKDSDEDSGDEWVDHSDMEDDMED